MSNVTIQFNTRKPNGLLTNRVYGSEATRWLLDAFQSAVSGSQQSDGIMWNANEDTALGTTANLGQAIAALFFLQGTATGVIGGSIGGVAATVTYATSAIASATALAAVINAQATVNRKVTATNLEMQFAVASVTAGQFIDVCNTRFTAKSGTPTQPGEFDISGSDTADALSLATAINQHPSLSLRWRAWSAVAVVHVVRTTASLSSANSASGLKFEGISNPGAFSTFTLTTPNVAASAYISILANMPGDIGNEVRLTATGTGVSALTNGSAGFLGQGTGGGTTPYLVVP